MKIIEPLRLTYESSNDDKLSAIQEMTNDPKQKMHRLMQQVSDDVESGKKGLREQHRVALLDILKKRTLSTLRNTKKNTIVTKK